jgi:hypothetical protein
MVERSSCDGDNVDNDVDDCKCDDGDVEDDDGW